ncbi:MULTISPECIES: hypothetical protein [Cupriavidus]|uniref:hypothetical protein n=1 Tax=Cupriavidus TaxID=106589 RepID=UPI000306666D|nr:MULTISPECIES: hypothetical protein [Cupriavidus]
MATLTAGVAARGGIAGDFTGAATMARTGAAACAFSADGDNRAPPSIRHVWQTA